MKCAFAIIGHVCIIMMGAAQFDEHKAQLLKIDKTGVMNMLKAVSENRQIQVVPSYATNEPNDSGFSDESTDYDNEMQETLRNRDGIKSFKTALDDNL
uniref:RxLR effector protein n=1 Tax=Ascaris lumbricoides TaxID=6252 RepID=A0A0M3HPB6_ASCLU